MSIKKKLNNKVKKASDKTKTEQKILYFTRKDMRTLYRKARQQLDEKNKKTAN